MNQQLINNNRMLQIKACQIMSKKSVSPFWMEILRKYRSVSKVMHLPTLVLAPLLKGAAFRRCVQVHNKEINSNIFKLYLRIITAEYRKYLFAFRNFSESKILKIVEKNIYLKDQSDNERHSLHEYFSPYSRDSIINLRVQQSLNTINKSIFHLPSLLQMNIKAAGINTRLNSADREKRREPKSFFLKRDNWLNLRTYVPLESKQHEYTNLYKGQVHKPFKTLQASRSRENEKIIPDPAMWGYSRYVESLLPAERFLSKGDKDFQDLTGVSRNHLQPEMKRPPFGKIHSRNLHTDGLNETNFHLRLQKDIFSNYPIIKTNQYYNNFFRSLIKFRDASYFFSKIMDPGIAISGKTVSKTKSHKSAFTKPNKNKSTHIHMSLLTRSVRTSFFGMTDLKGIQKNPTLRSVNIIQKGNKTSFTSRKNLNGRERVKQQLSWQRVEYPGLNISFAKSLTMKGPKIKHQNGPGETSVIYSKEPSLEKITTNNAEPNESFHDIGNMAKSMPDENQRNFATELFQKIPSRQVSILADKVYNLLEKRIFVEQDRRGFI